MAMADGTNAPCVKKDTKGVRGKNGDEAHSRQLRVMNFFEYCNVDGKGTPVPIRGSFSYAVTDGEIAEATGLLKAQGVARGSGTVPRMQCVGRNLANPAIFQIRKNLSALTGRGTCTRPSQHRSKAADSDARDGGPR